MTVLSATSWATNADMILDVVDLGLIKPTDQVLDLTWGRGTWWKKYDHPTGIVANVGLGPSDRFVGLKSIRVHHDYRDLPIEWANSFDVVCFDPPYIAMGGRKTSGLPDFMDRFGLEAAPGDPKSLHEYNVQGLAEAMRVCTPKGFVMTKCADYISSGRLQLGSHWMLEDALNLGFKVHDKLIHVGHARVQPGGRRTVHARQNTSVLWIFQKPAARRKK